MHAYVCIFDSNVSLFDDREGVSEDNCVECDEDGDGEDEQKDEDFRVRKKRSAGLINVDFRTRLNSA